MKINLNYPKHAAHIQIKDKRVKLEMFNCSELRKFTYWSHLWGARKTVKVVFLYSTMWRRITKRNKNTRKEKKKASTKSRKNVEVKYEASITITNLTPQLVVAPTSGWFNSMKIFLVLGGFDTTNSSHNICVCWSGGWIKQFRHHKQGLSVTNFSVCFLQ